MIRKIAIAVLSAIALLLILVTTAPAQSDPAYKSILLKNANPTSFWYSRPIGTIFYDADSGIFKFHDATGWFNPRNGGGTVGPQYLQSNFVNTFGGNTVLDLNGHTLTIKHNGSAGGFDYGDLNTVTGNWSSALGYSNIVSSPTSSAIGTGNTVSAGASFAAGNGNIASGTYSIAMGFSNSATFNGNIALGYTSTATGDGSVAIGVATKSTGHGSLAMGWGGGGSTKETLAGADGSVAIFTTTSTQTAGHGANAINSAIIGGRNHNIASGNDRAFIGGGDGIKLTSGYTDHAVFANVAIFSTPGAGSTDDILTWNSTSKKITKVAQSTFQAGDGDLTSIAGLAGTGGGLFKTAANTWALRTLTAGTNISVTNGDGVSGNPTIAINGRIPYANIVAPTAASRILGRRSGSTGDWEELTFGTNISVSSGGVINVTGGVAGSDTQVQFNDAGVQAGNANLIYNKTTSTLTTVNVSATLVTANSMGATDASFTNTTAFTSTLTHGASGSQNVQVGGSFMDSYTDANNSGTTETDLYTFTTLGSFLNANHEKIAFKYVGTFNDATASAQLKVYFGGSVLADFGVIPIGSTTGTWTVEGYIIRTSSTAVRGYAELRIPFTTVAGQNFSALADLTGLSLTSSTNILKITATASGAGGGSNDITGRMAFASWYPAN